MGPPPATPPERRRSSQAVLSAILTWTSAAMASRIGVTIDPAKIDSATIRRVGKVMCVYTTRPFVHGAAARLEVI